MTGTHTQDKERVARNSIYASGAMSVAKFAVGVSTGSLGLVSEGLHSLLDLAATVMTYFAVRISGKPADDNHPYGHGKAESLAALGATVLLFATSGWVVYEAVKRLFHGGHEVEVTWWAVVVILASIGLDYWRVRALRRVAKATKSQALEADALHFASDILSSLVVLAGLGFVAFGWGWADAVASLGVAVFVAKAGWEMGMRTLDVLMDAAPEGVADTVRRLAEGTPAVLAVRKVRARPAGHVLYVDVDVEVARALPAIKITETKDALQARIVAEMPEAEVSIVVHTVVPDSETVQQKVFVAAAALHLPVHHVTVQRIGEKTAVALDVEMDGAMPMDEAHGLATALEQAVEAELGDDVEVEAHIEPLQDGEMDGMEEDAGDVAAFLRQRAEGLEGLTNIHDVRLRATPQGQVLVFHCVVAGTTTVAATHDLVDTLERAVRKQYPALVRVVGHAEPEAD